MVVGSLLLIVAPDWQETVFLLAEQTTIHSCYNRLFIGVILLIVCIQSVLIA